MQSTEFDAAAKITAQFADIKEAYKTSGNSDLFLNQLGLWKIHAVEEFGKILSPERLALFKAIRVRADWSQYPEDVGKEHETFLWALMMEMENHPERFGSAIVKKSSAAKSRSKGNIEPLTLPDKVTYEWLRHNVPMSFWFWLGGIILAAFLVGVRVGAIPALSSLFH